MWWIEFIIRLLMIINDGVVIVDILEIVFINGLKNVVSVNRIVIVIVVKLVWLLVVILVDDLM